MLHPLSLLACRSQDCFSDFRLAPGGAATWLYVLHGTRVALLLPPTLANRRLYLAWAAATRAQQPRGNVLVDCLLADHAEGAVKVEVRRAAATCTCRLLAAARLRLRILAFWLSAALSPCA